MGTIVNRAGNPFINLASYHFALLIFSFLMIFFLPKFPGYPLISIIVLGTKYNNQRVYPEILLKVIYSNPSHPTLRTWSAQCLYNVTGWVSMWAYDILSLLCMFYR